MGSSSPRSSSMKSRKSKDSKNPYANRGLDKFSELLADLEDKRKKIYTQKGSEDLFVRFVYNNTDDCRPIIVKLNDKNKQVLEDIIVKDKHMTRKNSSEATQDKLLVVPPRPSNDAPRPQPHHQQNHMNKSNMITNLMKLDNWCKPSYYLPAIIILIMVFLIFFGRSFAILCTSIGWYMIPTIKEANNAQGKRHIKKKEYMRKLSHQNYKVNGADGSSSPTSVLKGPMMKHKSFQHIGQRSFQLCGRKSWRTNSN